uniref:NlpC/P60 domain-containing protein n=1 Tax=Strigops habroptila TaxID=2489341 RepID=A0A672UF74_STRHB
GTGGPETQLGPQAVAGAASTAAFFLCEGLLGQHFNVVPNGVSEPQPGDLFLFPLASGGPGWWGAHAGVYCGDGEIIHLEGGDVLGDTSWSTFKCWSWSILPWRTSVALSSLYVAING